MGRNEQSCMVLALNTKEETLVFRYGVKSFLLSHDMHTFCACFRFHSFCRSYSSRAHRRHVDNVDGINSQVGQCRGVCCVIYTYKMYVAFKINWVISDFVTNGLSLKILLWQMTPSQYQTRGT